MKRGHEKFMTEKEKNYIAFCFTKNIKKSERFKNYAIFFNKNKKIEERKIINKKENVSEKPEKKMIMKDIIKTCLVKTVKKSIKPPRIMLENKQIEVSKQLSINLKLEDLFDKVLAKKYDIYKNDEEKKCFYDLSFDVNDFYEYLNIPKFYILLADLFENYDEEIKKDIFVFLLQFSIGINHIKEFKQFVEKSYTYFPDIDESNLTDTKFFEYFYYNICNVILGSSILLEQPNLVDIFYKYLANDDLEMLFALDDDVSAWEFLAVFIKLLEEEEQTIIVSLIKERIIDTVMEKDDEKMKGLTLFLDAIGLEKKDICNN